VPSDLKSMLAAACEVDRHRGEELRHAVQRSLLEGRAERPSFLDRLVAASLRAARRERHSMTNYACRLPDGKIGRTAVVLVAGEWELVCQVA
jgi:hypothetical protein